MSLMTSARPTTPTDHVGVPEARRRRALRQPVEKTTLLLLAAIVLAPMVWFVSVAFRPSHELYQVFPNTFTLDNFDQAIERVPEMGGYYLTSMIVTFGSVAAITLTAAMAGFAFARLEFPGRSVMLWIITGTIFVPHITAVAALWIELFELDLLDTHIGLILVYVAWGVNTSTFIMRNVFLGVPAELEQAAKIDGASMWHVLWKVYVPLAKGGLIVVAMLSFIGIWGEFLFAYTFAGDKVMPMSLGIRFFMPSGSDPTYTFNAAAAAALLMFVPPLVVYLFFQRWLSSGLMEGALKG